MSIFFLHLFIYLILFISPVIYLSILFIIYYFAIYVFFFDTRIHKNTCVRMFVIWFTHGTFTDVVSLISQLQYMRSTESFGIHLTLAAVTNPTINTRAQRNMNSGSMYQHATAQQKSTLGITHVVGEPAECNLNSKA